MLFIKLEYETDGLVSPIITISQISSFAEHDFLLLDAHGRVKIFYSSYVSLFALLIQMATFLGSLRLFIYCFVDLIVHLISICLIFITARLDIHNIYLLIV